MDTMINKNISRGFLNSRTIIQSSLQKRILLLVSDVAEVEPDRIFASGPMVSEAQLAKIRSRPVRLKL
jgi:hypothetical protein